jgi:hypothetical protein
MSNLSFQHIFLSFFFTLGGTVGGWALTGKLAGASAASSFFKVGLITVLIMSAVQLIFFLLGKKRLIYRVVFNIAYGCGLVWFMLCLLLPMLWVEKISATAKLLLFFFLAVICIANGLKAGMLFKTKWKSQGEGGIKRNYNSEENTIDWPKVLAPMSCSMDLYIPGIPKSMNPFISLAIIFSMLTGLSLRNIFPTFSLFAWGIPSCLAISMFAQLIGFGVAQIEKLVALERRFGKQIKPKT